MSVLNIFRRISKFDIKIRYQNSIYSSCNHRITKILKQRKIRKLKLETGKKKKEKITQQNSIESSFVRWKSESLILKIVSQSLCSQVSDCSSFLSWILINIVSEGISFEKHVQKIVWLRTRIYFTEDPLLSTYVTTVVTLVSVQNHAQRFRD